MSEQTEMGVQTGVERRLQVSGVAATVHTVGEMLLAMDRCYTGALSFERLFAADSGRPTPAVRGRIRTHAVESARLGSQGFGMTGVGLRGSVWPADYLRLERVELGSPGFWVVLGQLNPLTFIRGILADRHERRKDREYREGAERRELRLRGDLLELDVVKERIALARNAGVPESVVAAYVETLLLEPSTTLVTFDDDGVLDGSTARLLEPGDP